MPLVKNEKLIDELVAAPNVPQGALNTSLDYYLAVQKNFPTMKLSPYPDVAKRQMDSMSASMGGSYTNGPLALSQNQPENSISSFAQKILPNFGRAVLDTTSAGRSLGLLYDATEAIGNKDEKGYGLVPDVRRGADKINSAIDDFGIKIKEKANQYGDIISGKLMQLGGYTTGDKELFKQGERFVEEHRQYGVDKKSDEKSNNPLEQLYKDSGGDLVPPVVQPKDNLSDYLLQQTSKSSDPLVQIKENKGLLDEYDRPHLEVLARELGVPLTVPSIRDRTAPDKLKEDKFLRSEIQTKLNQRVEMMERFKRMEIPTTDSKGNPRPFDEMEKEVRELLPESSRGVTPDRVNSLENKVRGLAELGVPTGGKLGVAPLKDRLEEGQRRQDVLNDLPREVRGIGDPLTLAQKSVLNPAEFDNKIVDMYKLAALARYSNDDVLKAKEGSRRGADPENRKQAELLLVLTANSLLETDQISKDDYKSLFSAGMKPNLVKLSDLYTSALGKTAREAQLASNASDRAASNARNVTSLGALADQARDKSKAKEEDMIRNTLQKLSPKDAAIFHTITMGSAKEKDALRAKNPKEYSRVTVENLQAITAISKGKTYFASSDPYRRSSL